MRKPIFVSAGLVLTLVLAGSLRAAPITLVAYDHLDTLAGLSGWTHLQDAPVPVTMEVGTLHTSVSSQVYQNSAAGLYAYLYQVHNTGGAGQNPVEMFTLTGFAGAGVNTNMGYLAYAPSGFDAADASARPPESQADFDDLSDPSVLSFYFTKRATATVWPGQHSNVMYVLSDIGPGQVRGTVIDGLTAFGQVLGAVPEPTSLGLLLVAASAGLRRRRV